MLPLPHLLSTMLGPSMACGEGVGTQADGVGLGARATSTWGTVFTHCDGQLALGCAQGLVDRAVDDSVRDDLDVTGHLAYLDPVLVALEAQAVLLLLREQSRGAHQGPWQSPAPPCPPPPPPPRTPGHSHG